MYAIDSATAAGVRMARCARATTPTVRSLHPASDSPKVSGQVLADVTGHLQPAAYFERAKLSNIPFGELQRARPRRSRSQISQSSTRC